MSGFLVSGYVKLYSTIITSSIWLESHATLRVWITMLTLADKNGEVSGSVGGLAHIANVSRDECVVALDLFAAPDPDSRTLDNEGRRIERTDGGWRVLNAEKYRDMRTETQVEWAERKRRWRDAQRPPLGQAEMSGDTGDMSGDKPIASSSATATASTAEELIAVADAREALVVEIGQGDIGALSRLLITRTNQGMLDNPLTPNHNPIPHGHGASHAAAEKITQAGVDPGFAADFVYASAKSFKPDRRSRQIRSVGYHADAVIDAWERHEASTEARGTSRPAATPKMHTPSSDKATRSVNALNAWLADKEIPDAEVVPDGE